MTCLECQIREFVAAKVVVGMHGAGLGNLIYMRPGGAVMEIAPYRNDARCLLGGGPFSRAAALLSLNYAMHHPRMEEFSWKRTVSEFNVSRLVIHLESFLQSIDF